MPLVSTPEGWELALLVLAPMGVFAAIFTAAAWACYSVICPKRRRRLVDREDSAGDDR